MALWMWIAGAVLALLLLWVVLTYNKVIRLENRIDNAWGQIEVQLKRRADLIPNLVDTVKGYKEFEQETLQRVTDARTRMVQATNAGNRQEAMEAEGLLERALGRIFAVAEDYPELKASENFLQLQDELVHTENKVAFARQAYNDAVLQFNNTVEAFPGVLVAQSMGKDEREMFDVAPEDRELPKVEF